MGPFPYDDKAKRFIVTMMDVYSRYIMAIPVQDHTAQTVSKCLYEHVVAYFGVPRSILSDRGAEFTSCVWESLTQVLGAFCNRGCDVSQPCVDLPDSSSSTSRMVYKSAVQVNLFSWPNHANTDKQLEGKRREFISSWKYSNSPSLFPPQQAPLVSQERLQSVVHKVAGNNKFKGKRILLIKDQQTNEHKVVTSLTHSRQTVECRNQQDYSCKYHKKSETDVIASIDQYKDSMQSVKPTGKQEERDANLSHLHQNDVMDDAINAERVGLVASNSHTAPKRSCLYEKENIYSLTNVIKSFFVQMACIFMVIENMIESVISRNLLNLKRVVGLATGVSVGWECCVIAISLSTNISYAFGGKRSYAYSSLNLVIYASWLRQFGRYIYNT